MRRSSGGKRADDQQDAKAAKDVHLASPSSRGRAALDDIESWTARVQVPGPRGR